MNLLSKSPAKASGYFYGRKYKDVDFKSWIDMFVELGGGALFGWFASQWRMHRKHGKAIDSGLVGLLHHQVYMLCNHHIEVGYMSTDDWTILITFSAATKHWAVTERAKRYIQSFATSD